MFKWVLLVILIIIIVKKIIDYKRNYKITFDFITFFEGGEGSGKTTILTHLALKERKKRVVQNIIFFWRKKKANTKIYSNYPIFINKKVGYSLVITDEILTWERVVEEGSIIVLDEMGLFFPMETRKTEQTKIFTLTYLRHILDKDNNGNNARIFASSQSMDEVNKTFRRKCNKCYELNGLRKAFGINMAKVNILQVYLSESINTQYIDNDEFSNQVYKFKYPKGHFSSTYAKDFKNIKRLNYVAESYKNLLQYYDYNFGDMWRELDIKL